MAFVAASKRPVQRRVGLVLTNSYRAIRARTVNFFSSFIDYCAVDASCYFYFHRLVASCYFYFHRLVIPRLS